MNQDFSKRVKYLKEEEYSKLSPDFKEMKNEFTNVVRTINKLLKRKDKIKNELKSINNDLRKFGKQQTELYKKLKVINDKFIPSIGVIIQSRYNNEYVTLMIRVGGKVKSVYLGSKSNCVKKLNPYYEYFNENTKISSTKTNTFKNQLLKLITPILIKIIDFKEKNWNQNVIRLDDIINELEVKKLDQEKNKSWF